MLGCMGGCACIMYVDILIDFCFIYFMYVSITMFVVNGIMFSGFLHKLAVSKI